MKHKQSSKDAMSKSKGTLTFVYSIYLDSVLTPIGCFTSSNRATIALRLQGILISRPTLVKYTELFDSNPRPADHIFKCKATGQRFIFTTLKQQC